MTDERRVEVAFSVKVIGGQPPYQQVNVFCGKEDGTKSLCGSLLLKEDEYEELKRRLED